MTGARHLALVTGTWRGTAAELFASEFGMRAQAALTLLTPREQEVLRLRFGIDSAGEHTRLEVAERLQVTRARIRQIEANALRKLRHPSRSRRILGVSLG